MASLTEPTYKQPLIIPKALTKSVVLTGTDSGSAYTNKYATGSITITLPSATPPPGAISVNQAGRGLSYQFLCVAAQNMVIQPLAGDAIRGSSAGVATTLAAVGKLLWLICLTPGYWEIVSTGASSGGGSLSITDGTNTVTGLTSLTVTGATINGSTPNATLAINIDADTHPATPNTINDEFEYGNTLDTAGARFAGATGWSVLNNAATLTVTQGSLTLSGGVGFILQPISSASDFTIACKMSGIFPTGSTGFGLYVYNSGNGNAYYLSISNSGGTSVQFFAERFNGGATPTFVSTQFSGGSWPYGAISSPTNIFPAYLSLTYTVAAPSAFTVSASSTGIPGSFYPFFSEFLVTYLGAITNVGIAANATGGCAVIDWFRRIK